MRKLATGFLAALTCLSAAAEQQERRPPNIVVIFTDDQGYADVGVFGAEGFETPNLDRMAAEGMRFTDFYVAQAVCSASRAALLTGCYPNRIGIRGALGPQSKHGIHEDETTLAELCKAKGYATAIFGKWHLGHHPKFLPTRHGFDRYFGIPYSNDMWPFHPTGGDRYPPLPLFDQEEVIETNPDQSQLTTQITERSVRFIEENKDRPFFLYVPHPMPHVPLFVSDKFAGKTERGLYGDVIAEIDWSVGEILKTLTKHSLEEETLVLFASDNGPWLSYGGHAGSAGPLREGKGTAFDGGVRVPAVARWPGRIPAGVVCSEPVMTIDVLPTVAEILGIELSDERPIDGKSILPLLENRPGARSPHDALFFYWGDQLHSMRSGRWKLHFPHQYRTLAGRPGGTGGQPVPYDQGHIIGLELFDMDADVAENVDVSKKHPDVVEKLTTLADRIRQELGDSATKTKGAAVRQPGRL